MTDAAPPVRAADLSPDGFPGARRYANEDLRPVPLAERRWTTYNSVAL